MSKKVARSEDNRLKAESEVSRLISTGNIAWAIYPPAGGFMPEEWGAWCIPMHVWEAREFPWFNDQAKDTLRFLRFKNTVVKRLYEPENWVVMALPPDQNPKFGEPVEKQTSDRSSMGIVPSGSPAKGDDIIKRLMSVAKFLGGADDPQYPGEGQLWLGNILQDDEGKLSFFQDGDPKPIISVSRGNTLVDTGTLEIKTDPKNVLVGATQVNPLSKAVPSSAVIPVQTFMPIQPSEMRMAMMIIALLRFFLGNKTKNKYGYTYTEEELAVQPTIYADYEQLRRGVYGPSVS